MCEAPGTSLLYPSPSKVLETWRAWSLGSLPHALFLEECMVHEDPLFTPSRGVTVGAQELPHRLPVSPDHSGRLLGSW